MGKVNTDHSEIKIDVKVFVFIEIVLLMILTFYSLLHVGYTTSDDAQFALWALSQDKFDIILSLAKGQGRFQFLISEWLVFVPYLFNNFIYLKIISIGSLILNLLLFMWFTQVYLKSVQFTALIGIIYLIAIQNSWHHNLITAYPFAFHTAFSLLLASFIFFKLYLNSLNRKKLIFSVFFFTLSLFQYETFCMYALVFPLLTLSHYSEFEIPFRKKLINAVKVVLPYILVVFVYLIIYLIFRSIFPGTYDGAKVAPFSLKLFFKVIFQYSISSFPTYLYSFDSSILELYSDAFAGYKPGLIHIIQNARVEWIVKAILAGLGVYICFFKMQNITWNKKKIIFTVIISGVLIVLPNVLYGLTPKYQIWVENESPAYVGTYFSYFGMILLVASLISFFKGFTANNALINKLYAVFIIILAVCTSLITDFENHAVAKSQTLSQYKWTIFDKFLETNEFMSLPNDCLIYAPSLWSHIGIVTNSPSYWTNYVGKKTSKKIIVTESTDDLKSYVQKNNSLIKVYYLKYSQDPKEPNQFLLFSRLEDLQTAGDDIGLLSSKVNVYTLSKNRRFMVLGNVVTNGQQNVITIDEKGIWSSTGDHFGCLVNKDDESKAFIETRLSSEFPFELSSITLSNYLDYAPLLPSK